MLLIALDLLSGLGGNHAIPDPHFISTAGSELGLVCEAPCHPEHQKAKLLGHRGSGR